jgi:hypothetical protein
MSKSVALVEITMHQGIVVAAQRCDSLWRISRSARRLSHRSGDRNAEKTSIKKPE